MKTKIKITALAITAIALSNVSTAQTWGGSGTTISTAYRTGNVGIGLSNPTTLLDVNGGFSHFAYNSAGSILPPSDLAGGLTIGWNKIGGGNAEVNFYNVYNNAPTSFLFSQKTGASTMTDLMAIKSNGYVGIGLNAPEKQLHVFGVGDAHLRLQGSGGGGSQKWDILSSGGSGSLNSGYFAIVEADVNTPRFVINNYGNVGIGMDDAGATFKLAVGGKTRIGAVATTGIHADAMLSVDGKIISKSMYVTQQNWADFVFDKDYQLPKLSEIEVYYKANGHLPLIPSAAEVKENGVDLGEMNKLLLQKIEELTILMVEQEKRIKTLETNITR